MYNTRKTSASIEKQSYYQQNVLKLINGPFCGLFNDNRYLRLLKMCRQYLYVVTGQDGANINYFTHCWVV